METWLSSVANPDRLRHTPYESFAAHLALHHASAEGPSSPLPTLAPIFRKEDAVKPQPHMTMHYEPRPFDCLLCDHDAGSEPLQWHSLIDTARIDTSPDRQIRPTPAHYARPEHSPCHCHAAETGRSPPEERPPVSAYDHSLAPPPTSTRGPIVKSSPLPARRPVSLSLTQLERRRHQRSDFSFVPWSKTSSLLPARRGHLHA